MIATEERIQHAYPAIAALETVLPVCLSRESGIMQSRVQVCEWAMYMVCKCRIDSKAFKRV